MSLKDNFLALEPLIVSTLTAQFPALKVFASKDLAKVAEASQHTPALHVVFGGYSVGKDGSMNIAIIEQTWHVIVAVRTTATPQTGEALRQDAGEIAADVIDHLNGLRFDGFKPLRFANSLSPGGMAGFYFLPLSFVTQTPFNTCKG